VTPTVLVLRALGLGDALTGVAALRGLRRAYPDHRLLLAAPPGVGAWLRDLGLVDDVTPYDGVAGLAEPLGARPGGHVAVNLHGRGPQSHRLLLATDPAHLVAFRNDDAGHPAGPEWRADEHEVDRWCRLVRDAGGACGREDLRLPARAPRGDAVVVHPGAASAARRWPADRWALVVAALAAAGRPVVVTGGPGERELVARVVAGAVARGAVPAQVTDAAGRLDLPGLADVVGRAALVVCGDTGVAHVATAFATPSVLLFGPTPPRWWGPAIDPHLHAVLWHGDPERPGDPHGTVPDPALAAVTVEEVLAAADGLLGLRPRGR